MNNKLRTRLLLILFIFGLGIYSLWPTIKYQLLSDTEKNNLSQDEVEYFGKNTIKQGLDLKGGIYIVLEVDLPQLVSNLAKNKDKKFDIFLNDLKDGYTNNSVDFFELFDSKATDQDLKLPRYFITYGKTKNQIIEQLQFEANDSINRIIEIIQNRIDQFLEYIAQKYDIEIAKKQSKFERDYPLMLKIIEALEHRQDASLYNNESEDGKV